jgi:hypothetical protein
MANTVFPTFQTQYILNFSSASHRGLLGAGKNTEIFQSEDVASEMSLSHMFCFYCETVFASWQATHLC